MTKSSLTLVQITDWQDDRVVISDPTQSPLASSAPITDDNNSAEAGIHNKLQSYLARNSLGAFVGLDIL